MLQLTSFVASHVSLLVFVFAVLAAIASLCGLISRLCASMGWNRAAHGFAAVAAALPQIEKVAASILSMILGRPFVVPGGTPAASPQTALPPNASQR